MFQQAFKNIDNTLRTDSGCGTELDYVEQTSWILFLKYLDDLEETKKLEQIYQQKLDNLEELKKSLLQKAFVGEL